MAEAMAVAQMEVATGRAQGVAAVEVVARGDLAACSAAPWQAMGGPEAAREENWPNERGSRGSRSPAHTHSLWIRRHHLGRLDCGRR